MNCRYIRLVRWGKEKPTNTTGKRHLLCQLLGQQALPVSSKLHIWSCPWFSPLASMILFPALSAIHFSDCVSPAVTLQQALRLAKIWRFPKIGVPLKSSILMRFPLETNHFGVPHWWKPPYCDRAWGCCRTAAPLALRRVLRKKGLQFASTGRFPRWNAEQWCDFVVQRAGVNGTIFSRWAMNKGPVNHIHEILVETYPYPNNHEKQ